MLNGFLPALLASVRRAQRRPLRTLLTVLEVALGALAVTVALNLVQARQAATVVPDVFRTVAGTRDPATGNAMYFAAFQREDLPKVLKSTPDVIAAEIEQRDSGLLLDVNGERFKVIASSITGPNYARVRPLEFTQGGFFTEGDLKSGSKPVLISQAVADAVFGGHEVTSKLIGREIGVARSGFEDTLSTVISHRVVGIFTLHEQPTNSLQHPQVILPPDSSTMYGSGYSTVVARAVPGRLEIAREQLRTALLKEYTGSASFNGAKDAVFTTLSENAFASDASALDPQTLIFTGLAIVMLIACSIGIFSITLVDIAERTREIGMRRALGATRGRIVAEILLDALLLSGLGAVLGVLIALPALPMIAGTTGRLLFSSGLTYSPVVAAQVVGLVLVVGGLLALYPALIASRLRPVEALREA